MTTQRFRLRAFLVGIAVLASCGWAGADPPSRVARMGYMTGPVSFSPAGENDWVQASINRPLTTGDRLWSDAGARAEIQVGGAMVRMGADTGLTVLNLDDRSTQLQLTQGALNVSVRRLGADQLFEVGTPNLAFNVRQPGEYRIEVDPDGEATTIIVRRGQGEVYGQDSSYVIDSRQPYRFTGTDLRDYRQVSAPRLDEFDRWSGDRDRRYATSISARYVSPDVVGYHDLDANGTWRSNATYGNVWYPNRVASGWAPYRDGHWAWVDPWGWTWIDDAPWGFAVSHYGRWANFQGTWGWVPGPVRTRAYYAPALVAFVGGSNFQISISSGNVGGVAWFPLGPRELYRPSYTVSRGYFENLNRSNTVINNTVINNYYSNSNVTNVVYANQQVAGAVIAVPTTAFVQSQPVSRAAVRVTREMVAGQQVAAGPAVAPTERSVRGAAAQGGKPPARAFERPVVVRTAPPAAHAGFAAQQQQLAAKPGKPLEAAARRELKPAAAAPAPVVNVVARTPEAPRAMRSPPAAPGDKPSDARGKPEPRARPEQREAPEQRGQAQSPKAAPQPQLARPAPATPPSAPRAKPEAEAAAKPTEPRSRAKPEAEAAAKPTEPRSRAKPEPEAAAKPAEPRPRVAATGPPPQLPAAQPRGPEARPADRPAADKPAADKADKPRGKKDDDDDSDPAEGKGKSKK